jgi:hypothetical protein
VVAGDSHVGHRWRGGWMSRHPATRVDPSRSAVDREILEWWEHELLIVVSETDPSTGGARRAARSQTVRCLGCDGTRAPWGYARRRAVRGHDGQLRWLRPRRVICRSCRSTHVVLPDTVLVRRRDQVEVIGAALVDAAAGIGARVSAQRLSLPHETVRGWRRRAGAVAQPWLREALPFLLQVDNCHPVIRPAGSPLGDLVEVLGLLAAAVTRRYGPLGPPWQTIARYTRGHLLTLTPTTT